MIVGFNFFGTINFGDFYNKGKIEKFKFLKVMKVEKQLKFFFPTNPERKFWVLSTEERVFSNQRTIFCKHNLLV